MVQPVTPPRGQPVVQIAPGAPARPIKERPPIDASVNPARNLSAAFNAEAAKVQQAALQAIRQ
ncbi:MAG: hypothetical protein NTX49_09425 [Chlamydiae bacterium]|nr:hypothetical protein [Chlamydiota bacterium]